MVGLKEFLKHEAAEELMLGKLLGAEAVSVLRQCVLGRRVRPPQHQSRNQNMRRTAEVFYRAGTTLFYSNQTCTTAEFASPSPKPRSTTNNRPPAKQAQWLASVVRGYLNYHAVPGNVSSMIAFGTQSIRHWLFALRRRSHKHRLPQKRFSPLVDKWIPRARILHPHPNERFYANHPK